MQCQTFGKCQTFGSCQPFNYKLEKPPKYHYEDNGSGIWKSYEFENGVKFREYTSHAVIGELPLVSITSGINPETGKMALAKGVIAIGQRSEGVVAIGQFASGYFSIGQFVTARIAGVGQFCIAPLAIGQMTFAVAAIGQMGIVGTGILQFGVSFFGGIGQQLLDLSSFIF